MPKGFQQSVAPFVRKNNWSKKHQQQHFKRLYQLFDKQQDKYNRQDIPAASDMEDVTTAAAVDFQKQVGYWNGFIYNAEPMKVNKIKVWRDMSFFPDISFILGEVSDEAINFDDNNDFISLYIDNLRLNQNTNIMSNLNKEWEYIIHDVMNAHKQVHRWFHEYMTDSEIFIEKIIDPTSPKDRGVVGIKKLRPEYTHPIWRDQESEEVEHFVNKNDSNILLMPSEMVAYANSGIYVREGEFNRYVVSYLEKVKVDYRKLKQMEDAVIIYRLIRAPERRVFTVEVGDLPKHKAEGYIQAMMRRYRQRKTFNPSTGEAGEIYDPQAMIEDFFFASRDGNGTKVDTLPGGENLGEIEDVQYFRRKLFQGLRVPLSRLDEESGFSLGDTSDITAAEVRFNKMVQYFVKRFEDIFKQIFMTHIRLKGYADEFNIKERDIRVKLHSNNLFQEYLEANIIGLRTENMEKMFQFTEAEDGERPMFAKEFVKIKYAKLTPEDHELNEKLLDEQMKKLEQTQNEEGTDEGSTDDDLEDLESFA